MQRDKFKRLGRSSVAMGGKKRFFEHELNDTWRIAREKGMEYAKARGHSKGSLHNDQKDMLYVGCEMQDIGCMDPADIDQVIFNRWREYTMSDENRSGKAISEKGFKKRKEALILLLKANRLEEPLRIVQMHKSKITHDELKFWSEEELESMTDRALIVFETEPEKQAAAVAHILHIICPPRREDTASMRWEWIDLESQEILFPAKKNGRQPGNFIETRFVPILSRWKDNTSEFKGGEEFVFPASMAQVSGSTKVNRVHITGKTISKHLEYIRGTTTLHDGSKPQKLSSHKYRHSFAMKALKDQCKPEFITKVLGDTMATVEQFYSRFHLNQAHRTEFDKMTKEKNQRILSTGTAQPTNLKRHIRPLPSADKMAIAEGFRLYQENKVVVNGSGRSGYGRWGHRSPLDGEGGGRWGVISST